MIDARFMQRCLQLALNGAGRVAPNPMVGAVLVQNDRILAEGWHREYGGHHAEVECLRAFGNGPVPSDATLYVNLEPCAHHGRTPPCVDLLIHRQVRNLVVGCGDPNPLTKNKGIARAREAGIQVTEDILRDECRWLNRRFITAFEEHRPYVILKWAQSSDGLIDRDGQRTRISCPTTDVLVHEWRAQEQAILVGSRTARVDDPRLTVRMAHGRSPMRVLIDRKNTVPSSAHLFDRSAPTLLVTEDRRPDVRCDQLIVQPDEDPVRSVLSALQERHVRSLLVEGGRTLLQRFIADGLWDEARVITSPIVLGTGTTAPTLGIDVSTQHISGSDEIRFHANRAIPSRTCSW